MINLKSDCSLCDVIYSLSKGEEAIENSILYETKNYFVLPVLGPVCDGHIMVVSKTHKDSLSKMKDSVINEMLNIYNIFNNKNPFKGTKLIGFEHGDVFGKSTGTCVVHTHMHLLPVDCSFVFKSCFSDFTFKNIKSEGIGNLIAPYLLFIHDDGLHYARSFSTEAQLFRKRIMKFLETPEEEWDWYLSPNYPRIKKTVESWNSVL